MKKMLYAILAVLVAVLIVSCPAPWISMEEASGSMDLGSTAKLPSDKSADTARSFSGTFTYQTLFPVHMDITVELYEEDAEVSDGLRRLEADAARVFLQLLNESGKEVFAGMVGADGKLGTTVYLPSANEDMTLRLQAEGFETREVLIRDMVEYEEIVRTMAMGRFGAAIGSKGMEPDGDGDGIPDSYDTVYDPSDSSYAVNIPAEGRLTVAFEDLYGRSDAGDADYNDFIASYSITEYHEQVQVEGAEEGVTEEMLTGIEIHVKAEEKIAGYDHIFGIRFNYFEGVADVSGSYIDGDGVERDLSMLGKGSPLNIELFESTSKAKGKEVTFSLVFDEPQRLQPPDDDPEARVVDRPPYNPYLYVKNTGNDVHLVGEESLDGEYDPLMFMDGNNFPWALLVPNTWQPPTEAHRIEEFYPRFTRWRESGGELSRDWYLHDEPWEPEPAANVLVFASDRDGDMELYSLNLDTDEVTQLTSNTFTDKHPDLSADRSKIAFVSDRDGSWGIYTMNVDGTGISDQLVTLTNSNWGNPSWSPDGANITYDDNYDIHIMNSDGSGKGKFTDTQFEVEFYPAWSPDGTQIAYASNAEGDLNIFTKNVTGIGSANRITNLDQIDWEPCWSPDGTQIAFSAQKDSKYEIYIINSDGTGILQNITNSVDNESSPSWSSHGIAYVKNGTDILSIDPGSGNPPEDRMVTVGNSIGPSW